MKKPSVTQVLTGVLLFLASVLLVANCERGRAPGAHSNKMIVVFATGDNQIIRGDSDQDLRAEVGVLVGERDTIKTLNGTIDLQTRDGSAIRVRKFTTITASQLAAGRTQLEMEQGTILANVKRRTTRDRFTIVTPTAIVGVRGTTFRVEMLDQNEPPKVRVLTGRVAMAPRVKVLEKYSKNQIESNATLKKLAAVQKKEEVLDERTEGTLDPNVDKQVRAINRAAKAPDVELAKDERVTGAARKLGARKAPAVITTRSEMTVQDIQETSTLVAVDEPFFDGVAGSDEAARAARVAALKREHERRRAEKQERVLKRIEKEASRKELRTEAAIRKQYQKLNLLILRNGRRIRGAVIAQTGNVLVVHTPDGVIRINKSQLRRQEFL